MTSILAAAALGAWSYAAFLEEPGPTLAPTPPLSAPEVPAPPSAPRPSPADPDGPGGRAPLAAQGSVPKPPEAARVERPAAPPPAPPAVPAPPLRYRLADASGQVWVHPEAEALRAFVEARNRGFAAPIVYPTLIYGSPTCASGRCR